MRLFSCILASSFSMCFIQSPDAPSVTSLSGNDLNVSIDQSHLTPPKSQAEDKPVTIYTGTAVDMQFIYALKFKLKTVILITPEEQLKIISRSHQSIIDLEYLLYIEHQNSGMVYQINYWA